MNYYICIYIVAIRVLWYGASTPTCIHIYIYVYIEYTLYIYYNIHIYICQIPTVLVLKNVDRITTFHKLWLGTQHLIPTAAWNSSPAFHHLGRGEFERIHNGNKWWLFRTCEEDQANKRTTKPNSCFLRSWISRTHFRPWLRQMYQLLHYLAPRFFGHLVI